MVIRDPAKDILDNWTKYMLGFFYAEQSSLLLNTVYKRKMKNSDHVRVPIPNTFFYKNSLCNGLWAYYNTELRCFSYVEIVMGYNSTFILV